MSVKCECVCGNDKFNIYVEHQVNGNEDTYEYICSKCDCGMTFGIGTMIVDEND